MSILFRKNARIEKAERAAAFTKYGQAKLAAIAGAGGERVHLERATRRTTSTQGESVTVDGTLMAPRRLGLERGDRLTMRDGSVWEIWGEEESLDVVNAKPLFRQYTLTKQRQT